MPGPQPLVEVAERDWDALLAGLGCDDAYLRLGYLRASALLAGGRPVLLHLGAAGGHVVFACLVRDDPTDVVTPYGYGGPVAVGPDPPLGAFAAAYEAWARATGVLTTFAVFHPRFDNHRQAPPGFAVERLAGTVRWRLDGAADLLEAMHPRPRRNVRRARRAGLEVAVEAPVASLGEFVTLYEATMARAGAAPFYLFAQAYWDALLDGVAMARVDVRLGGELAASLLCLTSPPWLHYHLGASSDAGRRVGASELAFVAAAEWGREHGCEVLHLGGGVGGRHDDLLAFKQRLAPGGLGEAAIGKAVHDEARYAQLSGTTTRAGYFPAYRRPRP